MTEDEKEFEEWWPNQPENQHYDVRHTDYWYKFNANKKVWLASHHTLKEKMKTDPSIGKLEVEDWPESPDY